MKYPYIKIFMPFLLLLLPFYMVAKDLKGVVLCKSSNCPISEVVVQITLTDGTMTTLTDSAGSFNIQIPDTLKRIQLSCSHMSYHTIETRISIDSLTHIFMQPKDVVLDEVTVKADWIYTKNGNKIVNVAGMPGVDKLQTDQLLQNVPGVIQTGEGTYSLNGKAATVYINGIRQNVSSGSLNAFLSSIPAESISTVELIPVNMGQYISSVDAVININTNDNMPLGYNIQPTVYSSVRDCELNDVGTTLFYMSKWNKLLLHSTFSFSNENQRNESVDSLFVSDVSTMNNQSLVSGRYNVINYQGSLKYSLNNGDFLNLDAFIYNDFGKKNTDWWINDDYMVENRKGRSDLYNLAMSYKVPSQKKVFHGTATYSISYGGRHYNIKYPESTMMQHQVASTDMDGWMHCLNADFISEFYDWTLYYGLQAEYNSVWDKSTFIMSDADGNGDSFTGTEILSSVYGQIKYDIIQGMSVVGCLRVDNTSYWYRQTNNGKTQYNYTDYLPSFAVYYKRGSYDFSLGYKSSIARPKYTLMLPGVDKINSYMYSQGNPNIKPSITRNVFIYNTLFNYFQLNFDYTHIHNAIGKIYKKVNDGLLRSSNNIADLRRYSMYLVLPFQFNEDRISGQIQGNLSYNELFDFKNGFVLPEKRESDYWNTTVNALVNYQAFDRLFMSVDASWRPYSHTPIQNVDGNFNMNIRINYSFLKNKNLLLGLSASGLFAKDYTVTDYFLTDRQSFIKKELGPIFNVSLKWKFNKGQKVVEEYREYIPNTGRF